MSKLFPINIIIITILLIISNAAESCEVKVKSNEERPSLLTPEFLEKLRNRSDKKEVNSDKDAANFNLVNPKPLSAEEKKMSAQERIERKYKGELPIVAKELLIYFSNRQYFIENNIPIINRLFISGPLARKLNFMNTLPQELELPAIYVSAANFVTEDGLETASRVHKVFEAAKNLNKPVLLFINGVDLINSQNQDYMNANKVALDAIINKLDDIEHNKDIFVVIEGRSLEGLNTRMRSRFIGRACELTGDWD